MSKTKYVAYKGCGFWTYDVALSIFLKHLIDVATPRAAAPEYEWLTGAISAWRVAAAVPDLGLEIDSGWSCTQIGLFTELVDLACAQLAARGRITADEITDWQVLDDLRIHPRGATEVETGPVIEMGQAVMALVNGTLQSAPIGKAWLYGTPEGREAI